MRLLIPEPEDFDSDSLEVLKIHGFQVTAEPHTNDSIAGVIGQYEGLIIRLGIRFDADLLNKASRLKFIVSCTTGLDHLDLKAARRQKIKIISLKGETEFLKEISATAELAWGLLLSLTRQIQPAVNSVLRGEWDRMAFVGHELRGRFLGIVGLGRLGTMVANYGEAFGMKVFYFDPYVDQKRFNKAVNLSDLAKVCDVITIHVPLNNETRNLLDGSIIGLMKPEAYVINTSRGAVIDEAALLDALRRRRLAGAALDVLADEEQGGIDGKHPLVTYARRHNNLMITPHLGGATKESMKKVESFMAAKVIELIRVK